MEFGAALLFVKDLALMRRFYAVVFERDPLEVEPTWVEFQLGSGRLGLHAIPPEVAADIEIASPPEVREDTPIKLLFTVADPVQAAARLEGLGAMVLRRPWGGVDVVDPEGNVFGLIAASA